MSNYDFDFLVVGVGPFGSTCARLLSDAGARVAIIDKRKHVGGNCYTETIDGIPVQKYGGHIFHTNSKRVWDWMQQWGEWQSYEHRVQASYRGRLYSLPVNLWTLYQVFNVSTPGAAEECLKDPARTRQLESMFFEGYSKKQWGVKSLNELPPGTLRRLPVRTTWDDRYFSDTYQAMPVGGWTPVFEYMLKGVKIALDCDYLSSPDYWQRKAARVIYSGPIDALFGYDLGHLPYRSLRFEQHHLPGDFQGIATVNYTDAEQPFTRILEHRHYWRLKVSHTVVTNEYPEAYDGKNEPYYPVRTPEAQALYRKYLARLKETPNILVGGRLGSFLYLNIDQAIAQAMELIERLLEKQHGLGYVLPLAEKVEYV